MAARLGEVPLRFERLRQVESRSERVGVLIAQQPATGLEHGLSMALRLGEFAEAQGMMLIDAF